MGLAAHCLQFPNRSMLTHLITTLGFTLSVFHGWEDFEGLKRKSVPDGWKEKSRHALGRWCHMAASLPRSREPTLVSRAARGGGETQQLSWSLFQITVPHSGFVLS